MNLSEFDYALPADAIATEPADPRDSARLLVHEIAADRTRHLTVRDLPEVLRAPDLLVVNDTRVRPARLFGRRRTGGQVELLLLAPAADGRWRALVRPAKRLAPGEELELEGGALRAVAVERVPGPAGEPGAEWLVEVRDPRAPQASVEEALERHGRMPLPPYIRKARGADAERAYDRERYQTVYARVPGAVAAPTAGLHFTPGLLARLAAAGIGRAAVTLHVGLGTFQPVEAQDIDAHEMHSEEYVLCAETARAVADCRARGGRVVAVGTTSLRVLESCASAEGVLEPGGGATRLFIRPGHRFRCVDVLLTNFHLPRSTLLMLVSALAGRERILRLYAEALQRGYRFFSYGDAMLLLP